MPEDCGPVFEVPLFGAAFSIVKCFTIGAVTHLLGSGAALLVEWAVLPTPGQLVELLPGWEPLAS